MGKNEEIEDTTEFTPDELQEIDRILGILPNEPMRYSRTNVGVDKIEEEIEFPEEEIQSEYSDEEAIRPLSEAREDMEEAWEEPHQHEAVEEVDSELLEEESVEPKEEVEEVEEEALDTGGDESDIIDITDLIEEIEEIPLTETLDEAGSEDIGIEEPIASTDESLAEGTEDIAEDIQEVEPIEISDEVLTTDEDGMSPLEELEALTTNGESVETQESQDIIDDEVITEDSELMIGLPDQEETGTGELEDISIDEIDEGADLVAADLLDIPSEESAESQKVEGDEFSSIEVDKMPDLGDFDTGPTQEEASGMDEISEGTHDEDLLDEIEGLQKSSEEMETPETTPPKSEEFIEEVEAEALQEAPQKEEIEETIEVSDKELKKLKTAILLFHPNLRKVIKDTILNDLLPPKDIRQLIDIILEKRGEDEVGNFLAKKLGKEVDTIEEAEVSRRRVITARPEYTLEGRERQKRLLKITRIFGIAAASAFILTIFSYQYIYKPIMAKKDIQEGVQLIRRPGDPVNQKVKDYRKAENLFTYVNENYVENYLYGYNSYARAYFDKKEYDLALKKLNKAYDIDPHNIDTINNLGHFYSRVSKDYYKRIKSQIPDFYYKKVPSIGPIETQLDVAIDFYRKTLHIDPENITAFFGIGNAYSFQGEHHKAREYYENILKVDKNSIVGYSGLLNHFIEMDIFNDVLAVHSTLGGRDLLSEMPSPLLGKLAYYYLSKRRTDKTNIRIDYGVESPQVKDLSDNPYPAVKNVLEALRQRDMDYPPLFLHSARLEREQKNLVLMERNLKSAISQEQNYFGALHLLGEYHYMVKEPVEAYRYFNQAIKANLSPPDFSYDDFYFETEDIGNTYAMIGNIFYYYFDKVKYRFGDELEEEELGAEGERLANYVIAQEKYEKARELGYKSQELFYNLGRIYYMKGQYAKAIKQWLNLYEDFSSKPELMFGLGNAFYHLNNLRASKGEYMKIISMFEHEADSIRKVLPDRLEHIKIYQTLSSAYNNIGALYQLQNNEVKSNISYWRAIDYAKRINRENEYARVNLARGFKQRRAKIMPVIDENIPFGVDLYREDMR